MTVRVEKLEMPDVALVVKVVEVEQVDADRTVLYKAFL
jgi:hypothetical protein